MWVDAHVAWRRILAQLIIPGEAPMVFMSLKRKGLSTVSKASEMSMKKVALVVCWVARTCGKREVSMMLSSIRRWGRKAVCSGPIVSAKANPKRSARIRLRIL